MGTFEVFPAIDLRAGKVVRLSQGDPARQTVYGDDPGEVARQWLAAGARWLHVVNLDGAFGEQDARSRGALSAILEAVADLGSQGRVQCGGGLRTLDDVQHVIDMGVDRAILGTAAIEAPALVGEAAARYGADRIAAGIDTRDNLVRVRGWIQKTSVDPITLGEQLFRLGLRTVVYTNIARDGVGRGVDVAAAQRLAEATGLCVVAAGGVAKLADVKLARAAGLDGVIIGRALYDGHIDLKEALRC